jgi:hypothetical protein
VAGTKRKLPLSRRFVAPDLVQQTVIADPCDADSDVAMSASEPSDSRSGCRPRESTPSMLTALKGLIHSLAKIDDLVKQNGALPALIGELEGRAGKTPTNSSLPPSSGQRANVADALATKERPRKAPRRSTRALSQPRRDARYLHRALRLRRETARCRPNTRAPMTSGAERCGNIG